jgi:carbonic anhydrase
MEIPGVDGVFQLLQFHIHTNSEHTMDGVRFAWCISSEVETVSP